MRLESAAYVLLHRVASADGEVCRLEDRILERHRASLGLSQRAARRLLRTGREISAADLEVSDEQKRRLLRLMIRVGLRDENLRDAEMKVLRGVAGEMKLGPLAFTELVDEVHVAHESARDKVYRLRLVEHRFHAFVLASLVVLAAAVAWIGRESLRRDDPGGSGSAFAPGMALGESPEAVFSRIHEDLRDSIVLIRTTYWMVREGYPPEMLESSGTGFFVSPLGHILTNKHVARPWLYHIDAARLRARKYERDDARTDIAVWLADSRVLDESRQKDYQTARTLGRGEVTFVRTTPNRLDRMIKVDALGRQRGEYHINGVDDLALLRVDLGTPPAAVLLHDDETALDPMQSIMTLGYPRTFSLLETGIAVPAPSRGVIRKIDGRIHVDAAIIAGNSGGPGVTLDGLAVGIVSTNHKDTSLGKLIPSRHALELLRPEHDELLAAAGTFMEAGQARAALDLLHLTERLRGSEAPPRGIDPPELRKRLLAELDDRVQAAITTADEDRAGSLLDAIAREYGAHWGRTARNERARLASRRTETSGAR